MPRKKWVPQTDITPSLLKLREKKKWQIAFRRYVIEQQACVPYAPYFGLDNKTIRTWFSAQFSDEMSWDNFGKAWQFEHILPVTYFDFDKDTDLKACWNFINLTVVTLHDAGSSSGGFDIIAARHYFEHIYNSISYQPALLLLQKLQQLENQENAIPQAQINFLRDHTSLLNSIQHYSDYEFELLNHGRSLDEVAREVGFLKKF